MTHLDKTTNHYLTDIRKQPGRAPSAVKWQKKARKASAKARFHADLYIKGGDLVNYLYWSREAAYRADQARLHLEAVIGPVSD